MKLKAIIPSKERFARIDKGLLLLVLIFLFSIPAITPRIYSTDEIQYFVYLRSAWIDGDLHFENEYQYFADRNPEAYYKFTQAFLTKRTVTGRRRNLAPIGCSLLWSPFFGCAHIYVKIRNAFGAKIPADGFSKPYIRAVTFGSAFLGFIGVILIYILLRRYFSSFDSSLALLTAWLASSLFYYMYIKPPMSHSSSFFIVSLFIFLWLYSYGKRSLKGWLFLGIVGGFMYLVREQNGLFLLLPLIEAVEGYINRIKKKDFPAVGKMFGYHFLFIFIFLATLIPQFLTYKVLNNSYGPSGFVTSHLQLHYADVIGLLFSSYHGFFSYTPIAMVGVIGLLFFKRREKKLTIIFAVIFFLQLYISASYSTWWAGASYGARRMTNTIPIIAIGLAALIEHLRKKISAKIIVAIAMIFVIWNFFFIIQFATGMVPRQSHISFRKMVYNQLFIVPPNLYSIAKRFLFDRQSFYQIKDKIPEAHIDENSNDN